MIFADTVMYFYAVLLLVNCVSGLVINSPCCTIHPHIQGFDVAAKKDTGTVDRGVLVMAKPINACTPIENAAELLGKVALVERGNCTFISKIFHAQDTGALGVIVYNNLDTDRWRVSMQASPHDSPDVVIPSVFISHHVGQELIHELRIATNNDGDHVIVSINETGSVTAGHRGADGIRSMSLFSVFAFYLLVIVLSTGGIVMVWSSRDEKMWRTSAVDSLKTRPAPSAQLKDRGYDASCSICLEEFDVTKQNEGESDNRADVVELPCRHIFHRSCIVPWLLEKSLCCPMCKQEAITRSQSSLHTLVINARNSCLEVLSRQGLLMFLLGVSVSFTVMLAIQNIIHSIH